MPTIGNKNKIINYKSGMTLIELLIVITIIGIISTIILGSLSNSRSKAYDSQVKQNLFRFRGAAENYYNGQSPNSYGPTASDCNSGMFANIDPSTGAPGIYVLSANLPQGTQVVCGSTDFDYAVKATLYSGTQYWCVDNKGASKPVSGPIGSSVTVCP